MSTGFVEVIGTLFEYGEGDELLSKEEIHDIINTNEIYCVRSRADGRATIYLNNGDHIVTYEDFDLFKLILCGNGRSLSDDSERKPCIEESKQNVSYIEKNA